MSLADKERWNEKYKDSKIPNTPIKLVEKYAKLARGKQALDLACGKGRHSRYLAGLGFGVDALDISSVALENLRDVENILPKEVDFDTYTLEKNSYDLIVCTYFLERRLFSQFKEALKDNGILIFETFLNHADNERAPSNPKFMLNDGELEAYFKDDFELLHLSQWWDKDYTGVKTMKASMVVRKK